MSVKKVVFSIIQLVGLGVWFIMLFKGEPVYHRLAISFPLALSAFMEVE